MKQGKGMELSRSGRVDGFKRAPPPCARDCARRRVSERNRRKAALSTEITQEGIHRRLKPISGYFISADWEPSSKQTRLIRHRRHFVCFPALLKSEVFRTFMKF